MVDISDNTKWFQADASNNQTPPAGFPENQLPSTVNDSARAVMGALKRWHEHLSPTLDSGGTANAQTLTYTTAPTAYVTGDLYGFIVGAGLTNTGATTINVNALGAKNIFIGGNALAGGELRENQFCLIGYDGTQFQLLRGIVPVSEGFTPSNPTGRNGAAVMMGIGSTCTVTPTVSGELFISLAGDIGTGTSSGTIAVVQLRYGTGTAPANAAAVTGTAAGSAITWALTSYTSGDRIPFTLFGRAAGLTVGTAYWVDISLSNVTGTATTENLSMLVQEMSR